MDCESAVDRMIAEGVVLDGDDVLRRDGLMTLIGALYSAVEQASVLSDGLLADLDRLVQQLVRDVHSDMSPSVGDVAKLRAIARTAVA